MQQLSEGFRLVWLGAWVAAGLLQGCAEVSFKRGARDADITADRAQCAKTEDVRACMESRGYFIRSLGDEDADSDAGMFEDEAEATVEAAPDSEPAEPVNDYSPEEDGVRISAAGPRGETTDLTYAEPSAETLARAGEAPKASTKKAARPPRSPLDRFKVTSWFKLGGRGEEVDPAVAACVRKLGPEHAPEGQRYTRATLGCLKQSGWSAMYKR